MKTYLALVMVTVGLLGCGAQELPGGAHDAGRDLSRPVIDASGRILDDAGCPPEGKMVCGPYACPGSQVFPTPECINGVWSCPILLIDLICPDDAGTGTPTDGGQEARDAAPSCSSSSMRAPFACGTCGSDTGTSPGCVNGTWVCAPGLVDVRNCPVTLPKCVGAPPSGCFCNPITGVETCTHDAGADAPP